MADRRRQDDELRPRIEPDDRLLPDVAALGIVEVVALVHHDDVGGRHVLLGDDPVPQDLGDLDLDRRLAVDLVVAGRETDVAPRRSRRTARGYFSSVSARSGVV